MVRRSSANGRLGGGERKDSLHRGWLSPLESKDLVRAVFYRRALSLVRRIGTNEWNVREMLHPVSDGTCGQ